MNIHSSPFETWQHTLRGPITVVGTGLHSGKRVAMTLLPGEPNTGIRFHRKDLGKQSPPVDAHWYNVVDTRLCTILGNRQGVTVATVEHLLAALHMTGIDNLLIELDGPEVPIMDGSALPFVLLVEGLGRLRQAAYRFALNVVKPVRVKEGDKYAMLIPARSFKVRVMIDFCDTGPQMFDCDPEKRDFGRDVAPARTFGFVDQIEELKAHGLALGGSLQNAVVMDGDRVLNEEGLRFGDELARHKALDVIGDLALAGTPIMGRYIGHKPGHKLNHYLLSQLFADKDAYSYRPVHELPDLESGRCQRVNLRQPQREQSLSVSV